MTWPTVCKGIFNPGYNAGMKEGPAPAERDMEIPAVKGQSGVTMVRVLQGGSPNNEQLMRKPFG